MKKILMNKYFSIIMALIIIYGLFIMYMFWVGIQRDNCIYEGGKSIENQFGIHEKCVKGSDK